MSEVRFTIERVAADRLQVRSSAPDQTSEATAPLPAPEALNDLLAEARGGGIAATRLLADLLGDILFGGGPGAHLRALLAADPQVVVLLEAEPAFAMWPWELARDPVTGRHPVAEGLGLVRVGGLAQLPTRLPPRGVLVIPAAASAARREAVAAATRSLARKARFDIVAADHPAGPALRRDLALGALLVHCEGLGPDGRLELDDGRVPVDRIGLDGSTWLAVVGAPRRPPRPPPASGTGGCRWSWGARWSWRATRQRWSIASCIAHLRGGLPAEGVRRARRALLAAEGLGASAGAPWSCGPRRRSPGPAARARPPTRPA
ncbi:MAG: hypothetical protein R3F60_17350 [bacterium]